VKDALHAGGFAETLVAIPARPVEMPQLRACHSAEYLELAQGEIGSGRARLSTGDTVVCKDSWRAATVAAGGVAAAVDAVFQGTVRNAFCAVRPPGHHAGPGRGMGFCVVNNVAVAVRHAQKKHGIDKVLVVDWDVHHGNGTQEIFDEDPSVLFFDVHQHPWYPRTGLAEEVGRGAAKGTKINCPLPAGSGRKEIFARFEEQLLPAAARFRPEMVFVSAGFDSRVGDPLGRFTLTDADFADLTRTVLAIAAEHAQGRLVSVLEGGYDLKGLASAARIHVETLAAKPKPSQSWTVD
jgi:acetoin utilization deacetylase AcuC-like enzyme